MGQQRPNGCAGEGFVVPSGYSYFTGPDGLNGGRRMEQYFPMWDQLTEAQQRTLLESASRRSVKKGTVLHNGGADCTGLLLVCSGQLRAYILSEEGREITLYRLFEMDICLFSASCVLGTAQMDLTVEAEQDSTVWVIPPDVFRQIAHESAAAAGYVNTLMARRFSEVMWLVEQVMWQSMDRRLAAFLLEESALEHTDTLRLTHEQIANHLGTAREVVTRMLRYFQSEGMVRLSRGTVAIADRRRLEALRPSTV